MGVTAFRTLSENKNTVTYFQGSYNRQKATNRLNLGVGYRKLVGAAAIIGVNGFIDNKDGTQTAFTFNPSGVYQRYSLGLELKTAAFDVSANIYRPMSTGIIKEYKVLKGWDITTKGKIPLAPALSLGVNMYTFDGVDDAMVKGNKLIAEYKPTPVITLRGEYDKPNGDAAKTHIFMGFKWDFATAAQTPSQATKSAAVWHKRYDKVERQYDVKIAKAKTETTPTLGNNISSADMKSTDNTPVRSGDGKTQATAYGLVSGKIYNVKDFLGTVPSSVTPTVKVEKISGTNGTDFQFKDTSNANVAVANVAYENTLVDQAGAGEAVLKMTFSAAGYQDRVVFVKTQAIASLDIAGNTRLSAREWGNAVTNADYGLPTSVQVNGQTTNVSYTFAVKSSTVGGVASTADISTATGAIASGKITDSGDIVITVTRAEVAGELASATKDITIPISKKTLTPAIADKADIKDDASPAVAIASGEGTSGSPFQLKDSRSYNIKDFVKATPSGLSNPTVKVYWTGLTHGNVGGDFALTQTTGAIQSGVEIAYTNGQIKDASNGKSAVVRIEFTYANPDTDKYEVNPLVINVYVKLSRL